MEAIQEKKKITGGSFLIEETTPQDVFIPEEWTEEQRMIAQSCQEFLDAEVYPKLEEIDSMKDPALMPSLLDKAGELGLLGTSVPQEYGGFGMDFNTSMLVAEVIGAGHSFAVALSAHTGIGTLPILYYGNDDQKSRYLPKLATGEWKASYCLTEPDSGSDANGAKSKAKLNEEGTHYLINGQKMWITNGGFADVFIVFAKIDDDENLSAFIVEKQFGGITMNEEEKKMGIKGSSTRQVFFNDCPVPKENLLSERGNGFKIALNILNIGRIKLAAAAFGAGKAVTDRAVKYANERKQFGTHISNFGAIQYKLAERATRVFASESASYRAGQNIDDAYEQLVAEGTDEATAKLKSVEQFAIECAILKVHASESLDYAVDEGVQIYGGMGYSAEAPMDRAYRDSRINRIFEGTNEINRMLTIDMILRRAMKGEIDLLGPAMAVQKELTEIPDFSQNDSGERFEYEYKLIRNMKKAGLMIAGAAVQKFMQKLKDEQELLMNLADMLIEGYAAESTLLRVHKMIDKGIINEDDPRVSMMRIYLYRAMDTLAKNGKEAIWSFADGDEMRMMLLGLKRFTKLEPLNLKMERRKVAEAMIGENKYCF